MSLRALVCLVVLVFTSGASPRLYAQSHPLPAGSSQPVFVLNGPWRFHTGDDAAWANPKYNDSGWEEYWIGPNRAKLDFAEAVEGGPFPGWQSHGHPGYTGYAWYRMRVQTPLAKGSLALLMPQYVDGAYEVYVNGEKIGALGRLDGPRRIYPSRAITFSVPAGSILSDGSFTLAIRFWSRRYDALPRKMNLPGGLRGVPLVGAAGLVNMCRQTLRSQLLDHIWQDWLSPSLYGFVGVISLFLFVLMRSGREYLWAGISLIAIALMGAGEAIGPYVSIPISLLEACRFFAEWIGLSAAPIVGMCLLGVDGPIWRWLSGVSSAVLLLGVTIPACLRIGVLPPTLFWDKAIVVLTAALICVALLVFAIAIEGVRKAGQKAWALLMPCLLGACGLLAELAGKEFAQLSVVLESAAPLALLFVFLWRFVQKQHENELYAMDVKQAQEVQQLLLLERLPQLDGIVMESVYLPARELGGDFFQVLADSGGSSLVVFGDVAGKGLPAAMVVAMLIGAIRARAKDTRAPSGILEALNESLCATRNGALASCVALRISSEGMIDLANAGHPPPYKNGQEIELPGNLPLGVVAGLQFDTHAFQLQPGDRLTFTSDGVFEARNSKQELFGFDRLREISREPAHRIADAARRFGQEDDITVLTIQRAVSGVDPCSSSLIPGSVASPPAAGL